MSDLVPPPSTSGKTLMERVEESLLPLINLVFLLLMFFIVAGQLTDEPLPELPVTPQAEDRQSPHADMIVSAAGEWKVNGDLLDKESLVARLPKPGEEQPLKIAAAERITMADLETLFRLLEKAGYQDILLLTEPGQ
ncbi:outer membrane transport energization protein ExbD [Marinobacter sp. es.048]|uniref:ExbD/TolR family protein n=1 Tax=Marinobacter sp. es.048 TaxID=1761795 RepID=UPI000B593B87|nr:biopolymer transporter ExbD [Marinobacter sp. es.048]SNC60930.1 outer membrane transport energization protein ExbD [Marinobacter sp. es.048]